MRIDPAIFALADSENINDLKAALQIAIELEHSTMPPYLYAMYSLRNSTSAVNQNIGRIIRDIAKEEMLHMLLACNILKAIGGRPVINSSSFVPSYPTHLPGTVAGDIIVPLKPFSLDLAENVFMRIEQPEHLLDFKTEAITFADAPKTIGEFYGRIKKIFQDYGDEIIQDQTGQTQPTTAFFAVNQRINNKQKAIDAIDVIIEQGEGTSSDPHFPDGDSNPDDDKLAHYYRFAELVKGKLQKNPNATPKSPPEGQYFYDSNQKIPLDTSQILQLAENPRSANYAEQSPARIANDNFNRLYTQVLTLLDDAFNNDPSKLGQSVFIMGNAMVAAARALTQIDIGDGKRAGPTFEFLL